MNKKTLVGSLLLFSVLVLSLEQAFLSAASFDRTRVCGACRGKHGARGRPSMMKTQDRYYLTACRTRQAG